MNWKRRTTFALALISAAALLATLLPPTSDPISPRGVGLIGLMWLAVFVAGALIVNVSASLLKQIVRIGFSAIPALLALFPVATVFDQRNWPVFHSWGLAHGSWWIGGALIACPIYVLLGLIPWLRESDARDAT